MVTINIEISQEKGTVPKPVPGPGNPGKLSAATCKALKQGDMASIKIRDILLSHSSLGSFVSSVCWYGIRHQMKFVIRRRPEINSLTVWRKV